MENGRCGSGPCNVPTRYWYTAERDFMEFATYYSLPAVSLKAAVLPAAYAGGPEKLALGAIFNGGLNHPGRGGHVVVFEVLVTLVMELLRSNPTYLGSRSDAITAAGDNTFLAEDAAAFLETLGRPLPPPMARGNYETSRQTCYIEDELLALVQPPVEGWVWTDEGRGKWGYVATEPGKTLRLKVNYPYGGLVPTDLTSIRTLRAKGQTKTSQST
ncbi:hypothetical protein Vretifemale_3963 [Volvox reticuliferus]|nr:hypothetical protein Vretifemale_3963 [Volvox reticuliferus]